MKTNGRTHTINSCKHIQNRLRKELQALLCTSNDTHSAREKKSTSCLSSSGETYTDFKRSKQTSTKYGHSWCMLVKYDSCRAKRSAFAKALRTQIEF